MKKKILVVDQSALVRQYIVKLLKEHGYDSKALHDISTIMDIIQQEHFSLILLEYTAKAKEILPLLIEQSLRILIMGNFKETSQQEVMEILELGVLGYIQKPSQSVDIVKSGSTILEKIKQSLLVPSSKLQKEKIAFKTHTITIDSSIDMGFVLIGSSTGGPRLIEKICKTLPKEYPHAVCVVQHMPVEFTANFAKRLNSVSAVEVVEAQNNLELKPARVIIAKGGWHLHFKRKLKTYEVVLAPNTQERFFVPSVDEMFFSAATILPAKKILAIELTGIGDDGADGMVELRKKGAYTIAESENTAIVYGMPKEAYERGGAMKVLDFNDIVDEIIRYGQN